MLREEIKRSREVTKPLIGHIIKKDPTYSSEMKANQLQARKEVKAKKSKVIEEEADLLAQALDEQQKRTMILSQEKGASHWLTILPMAEHGFSLHKGAFRDGLCLRYGWKPEKLPTACACGKQFNVEHALSCNRGGFPILRHNELRNITASMLSQVCPNVSVEPHLQPLNGEEMTHATAVREENARLDVKANGFWGDNFHTTFFDVRVFNPHAPSNRTITPSSMYQKHEKAKRRAYDQRITQIEQGSFSPLVFSTTGGMGRAAVTVYKRLAGMIAEKKGQDYSQTLRWLRCRLNFALLRSSIMCLRGARSKNNAPSTHDAASPDVVLQECRISFES